MKYQAYQEYKDSGVEWLGRVPKHWAVSKLGRLAFMQEGPGLRNWQFKNKGTRVICVTNITSDGIDFSKLEKFISNSEYLSLYQHFTVNSGDILLSSSGNSWGKVAVYDTNEKVILNTSTIRLNQLKHKPLTLAFLQYYLTSIACREQLSVLMTGSCQPNFGPTHLKEIKTPIVPVSEQISVANFLDHETAKIDILIEKQQQLINLLKEKRQAVISHAVTKGLNPDAPMRDAGVEWLGEVPAHWVIKKSFFVFAASPRN
ncbi:MAG: restriction endonuclease subunit S, partial [Psychrosphaera sp.]|nr:restriction endonuclease subunit S [Psychrosphaera sp.]